MSQKKLIIADDEYLMLEFLSETFKRQGYEIIACRTAEEVLDLSENIRPSGAIVDLKMPGLDGISLIKILREKYPVIGLILITAFGDVNNAIKAMKAGADDYLTKPFSAEAIIHSLEKALKKKHKGPSEANQKNFGYSSIIGQSSSIKDIISTIDRIAANDVTVLISGESGTGKELIARYIHYKSNRSSNPFLTVNCGAVPETLLESELFGHMKGSFTGAIKDKTGLFEAADTGTIFLDEIGEVSPAVQVKLLRAIETKEIMPVGSTEQKKVDIRIVSATNKNLEKEIEKGTFREDLFYRLNIIHVKIPPLRERAEDIIHLSNFFLKKYADDTEFKNMVLSTEAQIELKNHTWPGNVRELQNIIKRSVLLSNSEVIDGDIIKQSTGHTTSECIDEVNLDSPVELNKLTEKLEIKYIIKALQKTEGNQKEASELIKLNRTTLIAKMKKYHINPQDYV